jgi:excisionase family DNA binding protein
MMDCDMSATDDTDAAAVRKLLTPQQVARLLNVSPRTVYRKAAAGQIPAFRIGDRPGEAVPIDATELEDWLVGEESNE